MLPESLLQQRQQRLSDEALAGPLSAAGAEEEEIPVPSLPFHVVKELSAFLKNTTETEQRYIAHCQTADLPQYTKLVKPVGNLLFLIGPEGDLTNNDHISGA